jgi:hypothetical protein
MALNSEIRWVGSMTSAVVRTAIWSLAPLMAGCPSDDAQVDDDGNGDSTTTGGGAETPMTAADDDTTLDGEDADTTTVGADDDSTTTFDGADSTTTDDGDSDTLVDGCWDRDFADGYYEDDPEWESFACALPEVCDAIELDFSDGKMTPEEIAAADAAARCMLEALRDATPAVHSVAAGVNGGQYQNRVRYFVLPEGVVGSLVYSEDKSGGKRETYRPARDAAFFDECLAQTELEPLVACLVPHPEGGGSSYFPALDVDVCIDGEPACPE